MRVLGLALVGCVTLAAGCNRGDDRPRQALVAAPDAPAPQNNTPAAPAAPKGSGALTGRTTDDRPKSLAGTIRGRGERLKRETQMRTIGQYYAAMASPPQSADDLLNELKVQASDVYQEIKDGYYVINPRALKRRVPSDGVIAYEVEPDTNGQYVVKGDGAVLAIPPDQLKAALAK